MNKSFVTNFLALIVTLLGIYFNQAIVLSVGLFALSGAVTNWLAVHMLFEKVPLLYGSGVIPARFEDFKQGIKALIMEQFFTQENIDRFLSEKTGQASHFDLAPIIEQVDLSPAFDSLVQVIEQSSFGGMLAMFGGSEALQPLKQPFVEKMQQSIIEISQTDDVAQLIRQQLEQPEIVDSMQQKVSNIIEQRLNELTPTMVKDIIQTMIRKHLGWLVVWGGVFGGLIGLIAALVQV